MDHAEAMDEHNRLVPIVICPTGPIGSARSSDVQPGVERLSQFCPEAPVIPVAVIGAQALGGHPFLILRRPTITIAIGEPIKMPQPESCAGPRLADAIARARSHEETCWRKSPGHAEPAAGVRDGAP
jgi:hypothetical protein